MKKLPIRRVFYGLHLWLGVISSVVLFIVCLSGCIYILRPFAETAMEPAKYYVASNTASQKIDVDELVGQLEREYDGDVRTVVMYANAKRAWMIVLIPHRNDDTSGRLMGRLLFVDPYAGKLTGEGSSRTAPFFEGVLGLHCRLWLPRSIGRPLVGVATIVFVVLLLTGLLLWVPIKWRNTKLWKLGFKIRFRKGTRLLLYDLHNTFGFYAAIPLLLLALTGLYWSFGWYRTGLVAILDNESAAQQTQSQEPAISFFERQQGPFRIGELLARHETLYPGYGDVIVSLSNHDTLRIQKGGGGFWSFGLKDQLVWDRNRGTFQSINRFADKTFGGKIFALISPIHQGDVFGTGSRVLFFAVSLIGGSLPMTGLLLCGKKLRRRTEKRKAAQP